MNVFLVHAHSLHQELIQISQLRQELVHVYEKKKKGKREGGGGGLVGMHDVIIESPL